MRWTGKSRVEVLEILKAICPVDWRRLETRAADLWMRWDRDGDGELSYDEVCAPQVGLLDYVKSTYARSAKSETSPPKLTLETKREWFAYYDEDCSDSLEQVEVVRALVKTFQLSYNLATLEELRQTVNAVWPMFDLDGSGSIDVDEFVARDGLGDTLIASLASLTLRR